jgi:branched-chain amino acid transport system substrate-binding protein
MLLVHPAILASAQTTATTPSILAQKEFVTEYTQRYGTFSGSASYSADALAMVATAIESAGADVRAAVRGALETLKFEGLTGSYEFSAADHGGLSDDGLVVLQIRESGWTLAP